MNRTYKYRLQINRECQAKCETWLDYLRVLYNLALEQRIDYWKHGKKITYIDQQNQLVSMKKEHEEYKEVVAQVLQTTLKRLDRAYQNFFRRIKQGLKPGFPRFKSKDRFNSFTFTQAGWKLDGKYLYLKNIGRMGVILDRPTQGRIKTVTIKRTPTNKWFVCFSCAEVPKKIFKKTNKEIGLDVGVSSFLTDSTGKKIGNQRFLKKSSKVLRIRQRRLARRKKGSARRNKARLLVAKIYEKVANQRLDFLHKLSTDYIRNYQKIAVENLVVKNMVKNKHWGKSILDVSWSRFFELLSYKAEEAGRELVKVGPRNTSQMCSACSKIVKKKLSQRVHSCPYCGLEMDRDENAAKNILVKSGWISPSSANVGVIDSCVA